MFAGLPINLNPWLTPSIRYCLSSSSFDSSTKLAALREALKGGGLSVQLAGLPTPKMFQAGSWQSLMPLEKHHDRTGGGLHCTSDTGVDSCIAAQICILADYCTYSTVCCCFLPFQPDLCSPGLCCSLDLAELVAVASRVCSQSVS